jgi:hypothetical protein
MNYAITTLDEGHILLLSLSSDFNIATDMEAANIEAFGVLEAGPDDMIVISDSREVQFKNLDQLLHGSAVIRSEVGQKVMKHRKVRKAYTVTTHSLMHLAAKGLNSAAFGFVELNVCTSLEDALEQARMTLAKVRQVQ